MERMTVDMSFSAYCSEYKHNYHDDFIIETGAFDDNSDRMVPVIHEYNFNIPNYIIGYATLQSDNKGVLAKCHINRDILDEDFALDAYVNHIESKTSNNGIRIITKGIIRAICMTWKTNGFPESAIVNKNDVKISLKEENTDDIS